ncbi:MAG: NmrA family NAD(P)-binding protein [Anaerolineae bacterium]|nr:NmrA family NAD(P)-binding protein [Anaerolineae bacterium]
MILVVGATGLLGTDICRLLTAKGKVVRALVRPASDPVKVNTLKTFGVTLVEGDLKNRASLDAACKGITTVITTATTTASRQPDDSIPATDQAGQINLVDAAKGAGVSHFIFISYSAQFTLDCPLTTAKRAVEQRVRQSGMTYTILRPTYFMDFWLSPAVGFDFANATAQIFGAGQNKISWIAREDVARFAVEAVDYPALRNVMLELGGPEALSPLEAVRVFEEVTGRKFAVQFVPEEALRAQRAQATDPLQQSFATLMLEYTKGQTIDMQSALKAFPMKLTSVKEYAQHVLVGAH